MRFLFLLFLLTFPSVCFANTGTVLIWTTRIHLVYVNFIIGVIEYFLIWKLIKRIPGWMIVVTILMNYISMFLGLLADSGVASLLDFNIVNPSSGKEYFLQNVL